MEFTRSSVKANDSLLAFAENQICVQGPCFLPEQLPFASFIVSSFIFECFAAISSKLRTFSLLLGMLRTYSFCLHLWCTHNNYFGRNLGSWTKLI